MFISRTANLPSLRRERLAHQIPVGQSEKENPESHNRHNQAETYDLARADGGAVEYEDARRGAGGVVHGVSPITTIAMPQTRGLRPIENS